MTLPILKGDSLQFSKVQIKSNLLKAEGPDHVLERTQCVESEMSTDTARRTNSYHISHSHKTAGE